MHGGGVENRAIAIGGLVGTHGLFVAVEVLGIQVVYVNEVLMFVNGGKGW